jgi:hypothetical protein
MDTVDNEAMREIRQACRVLAMVQLGRGRPSFADAAHVERLTDALLKKAAEVAVCTHTDGPGVIVRATKYIAHTHATGQLAKPRTKGCPVGTAPRRPPSGLFVPLRLLFRLPAMLRRHEASGQYRGDACWGGAQGRPKVTQPTEASPVSPRIEFRRCLVSYFTVRRRRRAAH